jgi:hypothetical protein
VENIISQNVGVIAPAMSHVSAPSTVFTGVVNADSRLRRIRSEVCPLPQVAQLQGTALPSSTPVTTPAAGVQFMGKGFDKYRSGSHATGVGG